MCIEIYIYMCVCVQVSISVYIYIYSDIHILYPFGGIMFNCLFAKLAGPSAFSGQIATSRPHTGRARVSFL